MEAFIKAYILGGIRAGAGYIAALAGAYFARYFRTAQIYGAIDGVNYLLDTQNDTTRVSAPCPVWVADGTAEFEVVMAEKSYTADCKAVTTNGVVVDLTIAYSATKYVVESIAQNIARIKIFDPAYTPTDAEVLDLDLNGTQSWVAHHFPMEEAVGVISFDVINAGVYGTLTGITGTGRGTDDTIYSRNDALGYGVSDGTELSGALDVGVLIPILSSNHTLTVLSGAPTYTKIAGKHLQLVGANALIGDGVAKLTFASLPTYDAITILEDGVETVISLTTLEYVMSNLKKYNLVVFKNAGVEVAKFGLYEYDNELTIPSTLNFYDVLESGATCVLTSGGDANVSKSDLMSWNFEKGFNLYNGWQIETGAASVVSGEIVQGTAGLNSIPCTQAYGVWEFDISKTENGIDRFYFMAGNNTGVPTASVGYYIYISASENIVIVRSESAGTLTLFTTAVSYISTNAYRIKVERNFSVNQFHTGAKGSFKVFIKGGSFGATYVLVDVSGGTGTNPVTDNTYTTSAYFVTDMDAGDKFGDPVLSDAEIPINDILATRGAMLPASALTPTEDIAGVTLVNKPDTDGDGGLSSKTYSEQSIIPIASKEQIERDDMFYGDTEVFPFFDNDGTPLETRLSEIRDVSEPNKIVFDANDNIIDIILKNFSSGVTYVIDGNGDYVLDGNGDYVIV